MIPRVGSRLILSVTTQLLTAVLTDEIDIATAVHLRYMKGTQKNMHELQQNVSVQGRKGFTS
jgi:hypothetical protein